MARNLTTIEGGGGKRGRGRPRKEAPATNSNGHAQRGSALDEGSPANEPPAAE